jgi:hypothetical protein
VLRQLVNLGGLCVLRLIWGENQYYAALQRVDTALFALGIEVRH